MRREQVVAGQRIPSRDDADDLFQLVDDVGYAKRPLP